MEIKFEQRQQTECGGAGDSGCVSEMVILQRVCERKVKDRQRGVPKVRTESGKLISIWRLDQAA